MKALMFGLTAVLLGTSRIWGASLDRAVMFIEFDLMEKGKTELLEIVLSESPDPGERAEALFMLGTIGIGEGNQRAALKVWELLIEDYPNNEHALAIANHLAELREIRTEAMDPQDHLNGQGGHRFRLPSAVASRLDDARAQIYLESAEFYNGSNATLWIDTSYIPHLEAAIKWYDRIISEFPGTTSAETAHRRKIQAILGWGSKRTYDEAGAKEDFAKYMPMAVDAFVAFEGEFPESSLLQPLRYQLAQAYWVNWRKVGKNKKATMKAESVHWLNEIVRAAGVRDSFYGDLAVRRLRHWW